MPQYDRRVKGFGVSYLLTRPQRIAQHPVTEIWRSVTFLLIAVCLILIHWQAFAQQPVKAQDAPIPIHYTDIRKAAGITFVQDSTQTDQKYYLETMGTGVGWIDYDQDGLMDLYFVQSAATDIYKPSASFTLSAVSQQRRWNIYRRD